MNKLRLTLPIIVPMSFVASISAALHVSDFDKYVCSWFFGGNGHWPMVHAQPFQWIYDYGTLPGWLMGGVGAALWAIGLPFHEGVARRGFFLAMVVILGPGLLVNGVCKPFLSRPRPCQIAEFGGKEEYAPVLTFAATIDETCKSFPSGHASMGFALIAPAFLLRRRRWLLAGTVGLAFGVGSVIGITRVVQGRHYPSDILWSAAIVYVTAVMLYYLLGLHRVAPLSRPSTRYDADGRLVSVPMRQTAPQWPSLVSKNRRQAA